MSKEETVNIEIRANMYSRFADFPNNMPNVLAEFVDNALQSYHDCQRELQATQEGYCLRVDIRFALDETRKNITKITISDNAAGINEKRYPTAFMPARRPDNTDGLNEYGMGLKTAACWLGREWTVATKALGENVMRTVHFNLEQISQEDLKTLPVAVEDCSPEEHFTTVVITQPTQNMPSANGIPALKETLASIYRKIIRNNEMTLVVDGEQLSYNTPEPLVAPPVGQPEAGSVVWKRDIDIEFLNYKAKGFIGVLKSIDQTHNGLVLLRRGRVVLGAEKGKRYTPSSICGSSGTFRYKRIYGELELEGFNVSYNKNEIQDKENLEALMTVIKNELRSGNLDILTQADKYRLDSFQDNAKQLVKKHNKAPKRKREPISIDSQGEGTAFAKEELAQKSAEKPLVIDSYDDKYDICGESYTLKVQFVAQGDELFWVDVSKSEEHIIQCIINVGHEFFDCFGKKADSSVVAILKTMAIAKYRAKRMSENDAGEMLHFFNSYIKHTKI